eukprot:2284709-Rhodomonas_salina.1
MPCAETGAPQIAWKGVAMQQGNDGAASLQGGGNEGREGGDPEGRKDGMKWGGGLVHLELRDNELELSFVEALAQCESLKCLDLSSNWLGIIAATQLRARSAISGNDVSFTVSR